MYKVLAVDDEPRNLKLIQGFLADIGQVTTASDGLEAWKILENSPFVFDAIVLDRMMPNMNGMELTAKIKTHPVMRDIPIIMQTAAAYRDQIVEGIKAGVYHYLTKPYDGDILASIVASSIQDFSKQKVLLEEVRKHKKVLGMVDECRLSFRTLEEAEALSAYLANFFPDPESRVLGISELLINAVEHGNLGIGYDEKTLLKNEARWREEVERRLTLPENRSKKVYVDYRKTATEALITIRDEGKGFAWERYLEFEPSRATDSHGRGIAMAKLVSFDVLEYHGNGNEVCAKVLITPP